MALWKLSNLQKKSCEERSTWVKGNQVVTRIVGWRWGSFIVETTDDNPPDGITEDNEEGINIRDHEGKNIVSIDLDNLEDVVYGDFDYPIVITEEQQAEIEYGCERKGYYSYFEENDWELDDTEVWFMGPLEIDRIS
jgi:hypothetical protein